MMPKKLLTSAKMTERSKTVPGRTTALNVKATEMSTSIAQSVHAGQYAPCVATRTITGFLLRCKVKATSETEIYISLFNTQ